MSASPGVAPSISVIMPAYNVERYIGDAIESILHQSFQDFELIIIDDDSQDATVDIIRSFAQSDRRIIPIVHAQNRGAATALNTGLAIARGSLIARMDSDDIAMPTRLEVQMRFLKSHPDVAQGVGFGVRSLSMALSYGMGPFAQACTTDDLSTSISETSEVMSLLRACSTRHFHFSVPHSGGSSGRNPSCS